MFKKTAIALGLAMVAGTGMAAGNGMSMNAGASAGTTQAGATGSSSLAAEFHKLDANGDGVLSPSEAKANAKVAKLYSSMNTGASIQTDPQAKKSDESTGGVTLNQFEAGMQAASGGSAGPAVSGGQTYTVMRNGSKQLKSQAGSMSNNAMSRSQQSIQSAGQATRNTASQMNSSAQNKMSGMRNSMQNKTSQMRSNIQSQTDHMRDSAQSMQNSGNTMSGNRMSGQMNGTTTTSSSVQTRQSAPVTSGPDNTMSGNSMSGNGQ